MKLILTILKTRLTTIKLPYTVLQYTGSLNLPGLNSIPQRKALCVNQSKMNHLLDLPGLINFPPEAW